MTGPITGSSLARLDAVDAASGEVNVIIETPKGHRNKFKYDERRGLFKLSGVLPAGAVFPFDFGFVPSTIGEDGDPLDVLVLMDAAAFTGCIVASRLIGVIEAEQTENSKTFQNDRLIAVAAKSITHRSLRDISDVSDDLVGQIEHFFISYNMAKGKTFEPKGRSRRERALALVRTGIARAGRV
jgi:inorganic pyrophosphatase